MTPLDVVGVNRTVFHNVIRLSLGKLLVNLLHEAKRTNTPLIP